MNRVPLSLVLVTVLSSAAMAEKSAATAPMAIQVSSATAPAPAASPAAPAEMPAAAPSASGVSVEKIAVGTGVESHEILGETADFPAGTEKIYCLSRVVAANAPTTVKHVWSKDGVKMSEVSLNIRFSPFTTYSYHFAAPGAWKVEVQDEAGTTVSSAEFTVR